jgi:cholesterol oxidase
MTMPDSTSAAGKTFDVVVIGSGFGGSAVACRLAQAGMKVAVLEQGRRYPDGRGEFKATAHGTSQVRHGHFVLDVGVGMNVLRGVGVGGGSLHYYNVRIPATAEIFDRTGDDGNRLWPADLSLEVLEPYYNLANEMLPAAPMDATPDDQRHPVLGLPARSEAFVKAAGASTRAKGDPYYLPIAVNTSGEAKDTEAPQLDPDSGQPVTDPDTGDPLRIQSKSCVYSGECLLGCPPSTDKDGGNVNARAILTLNYLAVAERNGAQVFPLHRADVVRRQPDGSFEVEVTWLDPRTYDESEGDNPRGKPGTVYASKVVLGAGSLGSVELLLKSQMTPYRKEPGLTGLSPMLGKRFSGNGDFTIAKTVNTPQDLQPKAGPSITVGCDFTTDDGHKIFIEDVGFVPITEAVMGTKQLTVTTPDTHVMGYLAMCEDVTYGTLRLAQVKGKSDNPEDQIPANFQVRVFWQPTQETVKRYNEVVACIEEMSQILGGDYTDPDKYDQVTGMGLTTLHPLGGAVMGDDAARGVVNDKGEVYGVPGLYVADAAIIPAPLAVNPTLTISALAERVAYWIVKPDGPEFKRRGPRWPPRGK